MIYYIQILLISDQFVNHPGRGYWYPQSNLSSKAKSKEGPVRSLSTSNAVQYLEDMSANEDAPELSGFAAIKAKFAQGATAKSPAEKNERVKEIEALQSRRTSVRDMANKFKDTESKKPERRRSALIDELLKIERTSVKDIAGTYKGYNISSICFP